MAWGHVVIDLFASERGRRAGHWFGELLVVVVGVLIALYAQQWASDRQSRKAATDAEARIRDEIYGNAFSDAERVALHHCLQQRLKQIADRVNGGTSDWAGFAYDFTDNDMFLVRRIYRTPSRSWIDDAYRGALTSGALDSVAPERRASWSALYRQYLKSQQVNIEENGLAPNLNSLSIDGVVRPEDRRQLLQLVAGLDRYNGLITLIARQNFDTIRELGYRLSDKERGAMQRLLFDPGAQSNSNQSVARMRRIYGDCVDPSAFKLFDPALKTN